MYHYAGNNPVNYVDPDGRDAYTRKCKSPDGEVYYTFYCDNSTEIGVVKSLYGFMPFVGGWVYEGILRLNNFRPIKEKDIASGISNAIGTTIDTASQLERIFKFFELSESAINTAKIVGEPAIILSALLVAYNISREVSKTKETVVNQIVDKHFGRYLKGCSHEEVATLYGYAKQKVTELIDNGTITYKADDFGFLLSGGEIPEEIKQQIINDLLLFNH